MPSVAGRGDGPGLVGRQVVVEAGGGVVAGRGLVGAGVEVVSFVGAIGLEFAHHGGRHDHAQGVMADAAAVGVGVGDQPRPQDPVVAGGQSGVAHRVSGLGDEEIVIVVADPRHVAPRIGCPLREIEVLPSERGIGGGGVSGVEQARRPGPLASVTVKVDASPLGAEKGSEVREADLGTVDRSQQPGGVDEAVDGIHERERFDLADRERPGQVVLAVDGASPLEQAPLRVSPAGCLLVGDCGGAAGRGQERGGVEQERRWRRGDAGELVGPGLDGHGQVDTSRPGQ